MSAPQVPAEARVGDVVGFSALLGLQAVASVAAAFVVLFSEFSFDACDERSCNEAVGSAVLPVGVIALGVLLVLPIAWAVARSRRRRPIWWLPGIGIAAVVVLTGVLLVVVFAAAGGLPPGG